MTTRGTFYRNELAVRDVARSKKFYGDLIGWRADEMPMGDGSTYTVLMKSDGPAGGLMRMPVEHGSMPPQWLPYVAVDDVDAAAAKVARLGGQVVAPAFDMPTVGRICIIADPDGARLGLIKPAPQQPR